MPSEIMIYGCRGCGSAIAEAILTLAEIPYSRQEVDYDTPSSERDRLQALNPLCQVPTLVLPNGQVLTETLAIAAYAQSLNPKAPLIPQSPNLIPIFWRWATMIVTAIYPTFTYGDNPKKWVAHEEGAKELRSSTDAWRQKLWKLYEAQAVGPFFLGSEISAIDLYLVAMTHWRPRLEWFQKECPKLVSIASLVRKDPRLQKTWALNFD